MGDQKATTDLRLHLGCGPNILPGWVNIDRIPHGDEVRTDIDLSALPYRSGTVSAILAEHVFEHLGLGEEASVWSEIARVLGPGGVLTLEVPDFEWMCQTFLSAEDDWRDFYIVGHRDHYAGCGTSLEQRWGILQTMFFGNQNGVGQFHQSAYTEGKLRAVAAKVGFSRIEIERCFSKGGDGPQGRPRQISDAGDIVRCGSLFPVLPGFLGAISLNTYWPWAIRLWAATV